MSESLWSIPDGETLHMTISEAQSKSKIQVSSSIRKQLKNVDL